MDFVGEVGDIDWRIRSAARRQRREEHRHKAAPHAVTGQLNLIPVVRPHVFFVCLSSCVKLISCPRPKPAKLYAYSEDYEITEEGHHKDLGFMCVK